MFCQQCKGGCYSELEEVVCSLQFVYSKSMLGLAPALLDDFQPIDVATKLMEREQAKFFEKPRVMEYKSFVSRNLHILSR